MITNFKRTTTFNIARKEYSLIKLHLFNYASIPWLHLSRNSLRNVWGKVFKNGPSKICGKQPLKNFEGIWSAVPYRLLFFKCWWVSRKKIPTKKINDFLYNNYCDLVYAFTTLNNVFLVSFPLVCYSTILQWIHCTKNEVFY